MSTLTASQKLEQVRIACESDLITYIRTVAPHRELGHVHDDLIIWWEREGAKDNQLVLLPRAHQKSAMVAYRVAWYLTKYPWLTILYVSATSDLAEAQLKAIKDIIESPVHQRLWPDLINKEEGKRERWTNSEVIVDHPKRTAEGVRDASVKAAGLTTNVTGFHADIVVLDDVVVPGNAYTDEGRRKVAAMYSQLASIENPGAKEWVVGTRYHPKDLYGTLLDMVETEYDEDGEVVREESVYETFIRVVETDGNFLWPRQRRRDGRYYGFNHSILARIRAKYVDSSQFYAQYYNDPNDPENQNYDRDSFQYYDPALIKRRDGHWWFKDKRLNIVAAMDFAFSISKKADYSAIVVLGMDPDGYIYVLDIDRFKTERISTYFEHVLALYNKWLFRKIRMEVTVAQQAIVRDLKENYIFKEGMALAVDEYRPTASGGRKEERMAATLQPKYDNKQIYHYRGGNCQLLEEELVSPKPEHDDIMDAMTSAIDILKAPPKSYAKKQDDNVVYDSRFGGVSYR